MSEKIVVLEDREDRFNRARMINAVASLTGKIRTDNGGRIFVIDTEESDEELLARLPAGARLVVAQEESRREMENLDPTELLFLDALILRNSQEYRAAKQRQRFGESPEEQELFTRPCTVEE